MKTIEITVTPSGETSIQTSGFAGSGCREGSAWLEQALGLRQSESLTAEFHQVTVQPAVQAQTA